MSDTSNTSDRSPVAEAGTPDTSGEALRLDGNAAAGMLSEVFTHDMTSAQSTCAQCGRAVSMGSLMLYGGQTGTVLRCPTCGAVQMRLVYIPEHGGQYWMDMRGMSKLQIAPAMTAFES